MTLLGVDLNATSARAVQGPLGDYPLSVPLDPPSGPLPLVLNLKTSSPELGESGRKLLRNLPHFTCSNFLPHLGQQGASARRWKAGRHNLDAAQALTLVWKRLAGACNRTSGVVLALPDYLGRHQAELVRNLGSNLKIPVLGSVSSLLAAALAGYAEQNWIGSVLVLDIDDHALSVGLVQSVEGQAHLLDSRHFPKYGLKVWQDRLINALSDTCVLQSRRDPRDVPEAEQVLFEQLDALLDAGAHGRMIQLGIQAPQWYQNLLVHPEQATNFCAHLSRQVAQEVEAFYHTLGPEEIPASLLLTAAVSRLPGLASLLRAQMEEWVGVQDPQATPSRPRTMVEDFGEGLIQDTGGQIINVAPLVPLALARAAHGLGAFFQRGDLPKGHLDRVAPLPLPQPVEAGPPRIHFQGLDYFLNDPNFTLGAQIGCHLSFDSERFPTVAPRHCEILFDHRTFLLFNRSREGTLVNDSPVPGSVILHPGDWIRLGPQGPLLRFLGNSGGRPLNTTA